MDFLKAISAQRPTRRGALGILAGAAAAASRPAFAQAPVWPDKPGRIVVAFASGSNTDSFARALANQFQVQSGVPFVVENRPGAGGWTGTLAVSKAPPDGATLTFNANGMAILGLVQKNNFDATVDVTPIANVASSPVALLIPSSMPVKTVKEYVAYAKDHPNDTFYASAGIGSINHLYGELFNQRAGINVKHVPYKGYGEALPDLAAGRINMIFSTFGTAAGLVKSGQVRLIAHCSEVRPEGVPDAPSVRAQGIDYEANFWWALFGPGGMSPELTNKINRAANLGMQDPSFVKLMKTTGVVPSPGTADEFKAEVKKQYVDLKKVIETAKIVFE